MRQGGHVRSQFLPQGLSALGFQHDHVHLARVDEQIPEKARLAQDVFRREVFGDGKEAVLLDVGAKAVKFQQIGHHAGAEVAALAVGGPALELEVDEILVAAGAGHALHCAKVIAVARLKQHVRI